MNKCSELSVKVMEPVCSVFLLVLGPYLYDNI